MADHFRDDTYVVLDDAGIVAACACGWQSDRLVGGLLDRDGRPTDAGLDALIHMWDDHVAPLVTPHGNQRLDRRHDQGGPRDYLDDLPLSCGEPIEVQFPGDVWIRGRYEVEWEHDQPQATFYAQLGGPAFDHRVLDHIPQVHFRLPPAAAVRRPPVREVAAHG